MPIRFVCPVCWTVREGVDDALLGKPIKCQDCHAMSVAQHTPAPTASSVRKVRPDAAPTAPIPFQQPAVPEPQIPEQPNLPRVILSTGDLPNGNYEIMDLVFAHGSSAEGAMQGAQPVQAFQLLMNWLGQTALQIGANAVINIRLEFRPFPGQSGSKAGFELYGYGTAVKAS